MRISFRTLAAFGSALAIMSASSAFAQTAPAPNPFDNKQQTTAPAPAQKPATPKKQRKPVATKEGQFATEAEAKAKCPGDSVVWVNTGTKVYHQAGTANYGKTKRGVYMCEKDTAAAGFRAAKKQEKAH